MTILVFVPVMVCPISIGGDGIRGFRGARLYQGIGGYHDVPPFRSSGILSLWILQFGFARYEAASQGVCASFMLETALRRGESARLYAESPQSQEQSNSGSADAVILIATVPLQLQPMP